MNDADDLFRSSLVIRTKKFNPLPIGKLKVQIEHFTDQADFSPVLMPQFESKYNVVFISYKL